MDERRHERRPQQRDRSYVSLTGLVVACVVLGGCSMIADAPLVGVPANAPARPDTPAPYLAVHDVPPPREETVMTTDEQNKKQKELLAARDRQNAEANALAKGAK